LWLDFKLFAGSWMITAKARWDSDANAR